jgi:monofunctional biosynthetic peptidoglycan transglycosylase
MEIYLNIAEWGPGIFGAEEASHRYFGRPAAALTKPQAAALAAVLPNPRKWSPANATPYIRKRQTRILRQMDSFRPVRKDQQKS